MEFEVVAQELAEAARKTNASPEEPRVVVTPGAPTRAVVPAAERATDWPK
jgi:hypothetical protein